MGAAVETKLPEIVLSGLTMPLILRPAAPVSDEELMSFSRQNKPFRIEKNAEGEIVMMTPVGGQGGYWETFVASELFFWAKENGGMAFSSNVGFNLPDGSTLSPDASWVSQQQWNALTKKQQAGYPPLCPEFVVEILSASDSRQLLETKMHVWMANGAKLAWMIDPYGATLRIYRAGREMELLERPDSVEADEVVPGFRLSTARLWDEA
ncbi:Uma2 family endonuclease [Terriglobus tenax]|uniref:Uma2 family endonuclease n=1 Tax=Terriglobus tenax TaxID=1111115 RepID=UPI0021DFEFE2|nr:Uma2 family endonuclease [Terriglobus tenax]